MILTEIMTNDRLGGRLENSYSAPAEAGAEYLFTLPGRQKRKFIQMRFFARVCPLYRKLQPADRTDITPGRSI